MFWWIIIWIFLKIIFLTHFETFGTVKHFELRHSSIEGVLPPCLLDKWTVYFPHGAFWTQFHRMFLGTYNLSLWHSYGIITCYQDYFWDLRESMTCLFLGVKMVLSQKNLRLCLKNKVWIQKEYSKSRKTWLRYQSHLKLAIFFKAFFI